jgi:membrane protease YdiL (CAAX protease family)
MMMPWVWTAIGLYILHDYRLAILLYEGLGCLLPYFLFTRSHPSFAFQPVKSLLLWGLILMVNVLMLGIAQDIMALFIDLPNFMARIRSIGLNPNEEFLWFALYMVIVNPLVEELFWRGMIFEQWKLKCPANQALIISSLFFGSWHWVIVQHFFAPVWAIGASVCVMLGGLLFGWMYQRTQSLLPAILLHGLGGDLPIIYLLYETLRQTGGFGP